ncbi:zf-TFIIB domain-containing protein [Chitinibacteraceae bacterium HSL-7]
MDCIRCSGTLAPQDLKPGLKAQVCSDCGGIWLDLDLYQCWLLESDVLLHEHEDPSLVEVAEQSPHTLFCRECDSMLHKYRIAPHFYVRVDRCAPCNRVWLDAVEWQLLNQHEATADLLALLSTRGQRQIREAEARLRRETADRRRFGDSAYTRLAELRSWLADQPNRSEMMAFLNASE